MRPRKRPSSRGFDTRDRATIAFDPVNCDRFHRRAPHRNADRPFHSTAFPFENRCVRGFDWDPAEKSAPHLHSAHKRLTKSPTQMRILISTTSYFSLEPYGTTADDELAVRFEKLERERLPSVQKSRTPIIPPRKELSRTSMAGKSIFVTKMRMRGPVASTFK